MRDTWLLPLRNLFSRGDLGKPVANAVGEKYTGWCEEARECKSHECLWGHGEAGI